jgi:hypothetical protein
MASRFCLTCIIEALLYIVAALGALFALRNFSRRKELLNRFLAVAHDRLGTCRPCIIASASLFAASAIALALVLHYSASLLLIVLCSLATGLSLSVAIAHAFMFFWKNAEAKVEATAAEASARNASSIVTAQQRPRLRKCCGR